MKRVVVLTGAGISAESGLKTFRGSDGLWEGHDIMEVASPEGFAKDPGLVLRFYNERRRQLKEVSPNEGHKALVKLESRFHVDIITQNVDDLHERAGSKNILHLHGELNKCRTIKDDKNIMPLTKDLKIGDLGKDGSQLRPHIVWFGENVPMIEPATELFSQADMVLVIGTSLVVYPAAGLVDYAPYGIPMFIIDPMRPEVYLGKYVKFIEESASLGVPKIVQRLLDEA